MAYAPTAQMVPDRAYVSQSTCQMMQHCYAVHVPVRLLLNALIMDRLGKVDQKFGREPAYRHRTSSEEVLEYVFKRYWVICKRSTMQARAP